MKRLRSLRGMLWLGAAVSAGCAQVPQKGGDEPKPIIHSAVGGTCGEPSGARPAALQNVVETECAFAKTMADRDFKAFAAFLDEETVFFDQSGALLGKDSVLKKWKPYFDVPAAPFSWRPTNATWDGKNLAYTTGPVFDAGGKCVARFNSIWRQRSDGRWRIVFDKGDNKCDPSVITGGGNGG